MRNVAATERLRVGFDCNALVSSTLKHSFRERLEQIRFDDRFQVVYCLELIEEFRDVIFRSKFERFRLQKVHVEEFIALFCLESELQVLHSLISINRDPKDNYLLALSRDGRLNYLITGDRDLLSMHTFESTRICSLTEFETQFALR